jgi:predicted Zn-dependent peptidase
MCPSTVCPPRHGPKPPPRHRAGTLVAATAGLLLSWAWASAAPARAPAAAAPPSEAEPTLPFEKYTLANGLEVILHEDHRVPEVAVDVWYKVGSKDEEPGRTGFAHLFEHLMFQGSKHVAEDKHFAYLQKAGASNANGTTSEDRTNYFEVVPANRLELALWLESDRMGFLLDRPGLKEAFDGQRDVVKNERRQRIENRPMGLVGKVSIEALYPPDYPYHHEVIGSMEDLSLATLDDARRFFNRWYGPNNAALVLAGDFDPARARALVEQYFGPIPTGTAVTTVPDHVTSQAPGTGANPAPGSPSGAAASAGTRPAGAPTMPRLDREVRIEMEAKIQQPQLFIDYLTPASLTEGDHEMDLIAQILGGGKASRLYRRLVYDMQIAQSVSAAEQSQLLNSVFELAASPMPGHSTEEIRAVIDEELARLASVPVEAEELARAKNQIEFDTLRNLEPLLARAERLQSYNQLAGDPGQLSADLAAYRAVDPAAIQRAAARFLSRRGRVLIDVAPNPQAPIMGRLKP